MQLTKFLKQYNKLLFFLYLCISLPVNCTWKSQAVYKKDGHDIYLYGEKHKNNSFEDVKKQQNTIVETIQSISEPVNIYIEDSYATSDSKPLKTKDSALTGLTRKISKKCPQYIHAKNIEIRRASGIGIDNLPYRIWPPFQGYDAQTVQNGELVNLYTYTFDDIFNEYNLYQKKIDNKANLFTDDIVHSVLLKKLKNTAYYYNYFSLQLKRQNIEPSQSILLTCVHLFLNGLTKELYVLNTSQKNMYEKEIENMRKRINKYASEYPYISIDDQNLITQECSETRKKIISDLIDKADWNEVRKQRELLFSYLFKGANSLLETYTFAKIMDRNKNSENSTLFAGRTHTDALGDMFKEVGYQELDPHTGKLPQLNILFEKLTQ